MFSIAVIKALGIDPDQRLHGKNPVEWTMIQAKYSKYVNRTYLVTDDPGRWAKLAQGYEAVLVEAPSDADDVTCLAFGINKAAKDQMTNLVCYLPGIMCDRWPYEVDMAIDHFRANPAKPLSTTGALEGASIFVVDRLRFDALFLRDGKAAPKEERDKIEIVRHIVEATHNDMALHAEGAIVAAHGVEQYDNYFHSAMSETGYRQTAALYNRGVENNLLPQDYANSFVNHIAFNLEFGLHGDDNVEEYALVKKVKGEEKARLIKKWRAHSAADVMSDYVKDRGPAIVIGSGASLDDAMPLLKDWKGATFCSTSHASTLVAHGCDPTYLVGYDIGSSPQEIEISDAWALHNTTLVTHPGINPDLVNFWEGRKLLFREMDTSNYFMSKILPVAYGAIIPSIMYLFSCSVAAEMSLAKAMGYDPIFMVGCDFTAGRFRKTKWIDGKWQTEPEPGKPGGEGAKLILCDNGEYSYPMTVFYKRSVLCVWDIDGSQCIMTSPKSIITEMPQADIREVVKNQGRGYEHLYLTKDEIGWRAERYLARVNQFLVKIGDGKRVVETTDPDWEKAVRMYMASLRDAIVHQGQEKADALDIEANMAHFKALKEAGVGETIGTSHPTV